jgi:BlaI family transcriptional regulator, penicillinase repressor
MARRATGRPTDLELDILKALWELGPSTVSAVQELLALERPIAYTTVLKTLQVMTEKRLVVPDKSQRAYVYRPRESRSTVVRRLVGDLLHRVLDGSTPQLVLHALAHRRAEPEELEEIRRLLDEAEGGRS